MRAVWDAIQYMAATGCQWAMLPKAFPPFTTVQYYLYMLRNSATLARAGGPEVEIVKPQNAAQGFVVIARRWVV